jgi:hypothetical protein
MPITPKEIVKAIDKRISNFQEGIPELEKSAFRSIQNILNQLKTDAKGNIKVSVENLRLISKAKARLSAAIYKPEYYDKLIELNRSFNDITKLQTEYFNGIFTDFTKPDVINEIKKVSFTSTAESLSEAAINDVVVNKATSIMENSIKSGGSFADMNKSLEEFILGSPKVDSKLASYSKQVLTDSLSQYSANYNKIITDDLGLDWYQYVGPLVETSRPICEHLVAKQWIHKSELGGISRGVVDGENVGTAGMITGTNAANFQIYRGGYNCNHLLVPVAAENVPKYLRDKFDTTEEE